MLKLFSSQLAKSMCHAIGSLAEAEIPKPLLRPAIKAYSMGLGVDMGEAEIPGGGFACFGDFFARRLKEGSRPICEIPEAVVSPCDGSLVAVHTIREDFETNFFVKGYNYNIEKLLGESVGRRFAGGDGLVIYLHPRDYHRVHAPMDGALTSVRHIPGSRYPVASWSESRVSGIYEKNERMVFNFSVGEGHLTLVMVAAFGVGHIDTPHGPVPNPDFTTSQKFGTAVKIRRGDDLGAFRLGSTVVLLWSKELVKLDQSVDLGQLRFGQQLGTTSSVSSN